MAQYAYATKGKKEKTQDIISLIGIAAYFSLVMIAPSIQKSQLDPTLSKNLYPIMGLLFIIMVLIPMYKMAKRKKNNSVLIETTRKGFALTVLDKKETIAWKDLEKSVIIYDFMQTKIVVRKIILRYGTNSLSLDNEPYGNQITNLTEFVQLLTKNVPNIRQQLIGMKNVCPWCGNYPGGKRCPKCEGKIEYVPRIQKIFYTVKIDIILAAVAGMFMGKLLFFIGAALIILLVLLPLSIALRSDFAAKPLSVDKI